MSGDKNTSMLSQGQSNEQEQKMEVEKFAWIINENLLRDEGVLYGISDSEPSEKIKTIKHFFDERIAEKKVGTIFLEEEIEATKKAITDENIALQDIKKSLEALSIQHNPKEHSFYRTFPGFLAYLAMVIFNFWLVYDHLAPYWEYPLVVAIGVYAFGILSLFHKDSIVYSSFTNTDVARHPWLLWLEEFVVPLVATLFILFWSKSDIGNLQMLASFLLIYSLFVFSGKGLLGYLLKVPSEYKIIKENRLFAKFNQYKMAETKKDIVQKEQGIHSLEEQLLAKQAAKKELFIEAERLEREKETTIAYFMSEFSLARATRNALSSRQLASLISYK